ncbi:MAG: hypothetical protein EXQ63_00660 [Ilumatobacteraceae bacterium]|nr:hypothetical protein [Ilumatobacteraceae bacterium]
MSQLAVTVDTDTIKNASLAVVVLCVLLCFVVLKVVSSIVMKAILLIVLVAVGAGAYTQRSDITACANRIKGEYAKGPPPPGATTTCSFLGHDFMVPIAVIE